MHRTITLDLNLPDRLQAHWDTVPVTAELPRNESVVLVLLILDYVQHGKVKANA